MNFEEFQSQSRLYVIGALEPEEEEEFERERKKFGKKAEDFVTRCYALHQAFALSLRSARTLAQVYRFELPFVPPQFLNSDVVSRQASLKD